MLLFPRCTRHNNIFGVSSLGAVCAVVEATFRLGSAASKTVGELLSELGLPGSAIPHGEGHQLHIRREISLAHVSDAAAGATCTAL